MAETIQGHEAIGGATKRGAPDPSLKLPPAVKAAADRAEALSAQVKAARDAAPPGSDATVGETLRLAPQPQGQARVVMENFDPSNPRPPEPGDPRLSTVQSQPIPPPAPTPPTPQNPEDWEHQFRSLKGRYDRDAEDKRRLNQQLIDTQRLLAQVGPPMTQNEGSGVRFNVAPPPPGRYVKQQEVQEYSPELIDIMGRRAAEVYEPMLQQVVSELQQVKRQIGGVQNTVVYDARVKMYDDLAKEIPNWDAINNHPLFAQWLDQVEPISRQTRRSFLNAAHNSNVSGQVVDIFKSFLADVATRSPAQLPSPQPGNGASYSQSNGATPPQVDLLQYAAPGRAKTGQTTVPPEKPVYHATDVTQFYRDKTAGRWAGREADADAYERSLIAAGNEGRIIRR